MWGNVKGDMAMVLKDPDIPQDSACTSRVFRARGRRIRARVRWFGRGLGFGLRATYVLHADASTSFLSNPSFLL